MSITPSKRDREEQEDDFMVSQQRCFKRRQLNKEQASKPIKHTAVKVETVKVQDVKIKAVKVAAKVAPASQPKSSTWTDFSTKQAVEEFIEKQKSVEANVDSEDEAVMLAEAIKTFEKMYKLQKAKVAQALGLKEESEDTDGETIDTPVSLLKDVVEEQKETNVTGSLDKFVERDRNEKIED